MADTNIARNPGTLLVAALLLPLWACGGTPEAESAEGSGAADTAAAAAEAASDASRSSL